jgi:transcriptional regulator with XRE-family HTH domain
VSLDLPEPMDVALGLALRLRRHRTGLSQTDVGKAIGVSFQQLQKYERGTNRVSFSTLMRLCEALGCSAAALVADVEQIVGGTKAARLDETLTIAEAPAILEALGDIPSAAMRRAILDLARNLASSEAATDTPRLAARSA